MWLWFVCKFAFVPLEDDTLSKYLYIQEEVTLLITFMWVNGVCNDWKTNHPHTLAQYKDKSTVIS